MELNELLDKNYCKFRVKINQYYNSTLILSKVHEFNAQSKNVVNLDHAEALWSCSYKTLSSKNNVDLEVNFKVLKGRVLQSAVEVEFGFEQWSCENYLMIPAVAYNGNRFKSRSLSYPPLLEAAEDIGVSVPTVITDVPRLNIHEGISRIDVTTLDPSTPAVGFFSPSSRSGFWLLTEQETRLGFLGIHVEENMERTGLAISLTAPGIRENKKYMHCTTEAVSDDRSDDFIEGDEVTVKIKLYSFQCENLQDFFTCFANIRKDMTGTVNLVNSIPLFAAWSIQEDKFNRECWEKERRFYSVGMGDGNGHDWQIGWVGGGMVTQALIFEGNCESKKRAIDTIEFMISSQVDSGFFHGCNYKGVWTEDGFGRKHSSKWHLIRKSSDALYFIMKQILLLGKQDSTWQVSERWKLCVKRLCRAFVKLWNKCGQFGQFIDIDTGDIVVGGSSAAGIAPAGLALAGMYLDNPQYIEFAEKSAEFYYQKDILSGVTTGAPGEILQCPDSESAFALLESFVILYEVTGKKHWIDKAIHAANLCMTWCVSYDYKWPVNSVFGKLDMKTAGTVIANVQNKHSAPGICTLSGDSLFKLYRATGNKMYLELIQEIAHNLPQYLSREDRPIMSWNNDKQLPPGWMCERVNMSDWEGKDKIGGVFYGSCWCEVSNMLTYVEVPGLYVQPDTGFICAIDHISVQTVHSNGEELVVNVTNPTKFSAKVKVYAEDSLDMSQILGQNYLWGCREIDLKPGESKEVLFKKSGVYVSCR